MAQLPVLFVGWTLTYEMYFYLIFAISILVPVRHQSIVLGAWALVTIGVALTIADTNPVLSVVGGPLNLEFLFGVGVGKLVLADRLKFPRVSTTVGVAAILTTYLLAPGPGLDVPNAWVRILGVGAPAALILYGVVGLESGGKLFPRVINRLGDYSYALYLIHPVVLRIAAPLAARLSPTPVNAVVAGTVALAASVLIAIAFRLLVEQPLLTWLQRLTEKRVVIRRLAVSAEIAP